MPSHMPSDSQLARAAEILNRGKKTVILAGQGAIGAEDALTAVAERLAAPVVKPLLGKGALPDDSPYSTGGIGLLGTKPSQKAMEECDTLLIAGSNFPYIEFYPKPGKAACIQIDIDPQRIGFAPVVLHDGAAGDRWALGAAPLGLRALHLQPDPLHRLRLRFSWPPAPGRSNQCRPTNLSLAWSVEAAPRPGLPSESSSADLLGR